MRKIKFRGKCISPKYESESLYLKWIYGDLHIIGDEYFIYMYDNWYEVDKDTVSQYIGVKDKNDREIYEKNNVKITWANNKVFKVFTVYYADDCAYFLLKEVGSEELETFCGLSKEQLEIID